MNASSASVATTVPISRAPKQMTLASLCARASRAEVTSWTIAARTPRILFAADRDADAGSADAQPEIHFARDYRVTDHRGVIRIVDRCFRMGTEVDDLVAARREVAAEKVLQVETGVVRTHGEAHDRAVYAAS